MEYQIREMSRFDPDGPDMRAAGPVEEDHICKLCREHRTPREMANDDHCYWCIEELENL